MALITISQSMGSADPDIARRVAKKLDVELFDDQRLLNRAKEMGIHPDDLKSLDEKAPGFFDRFFSSKPESYLKFMESIVYEVAKAGRGVIMGHGSQVLLRDFGCALHVLIHAPENYRIGQVVKKLGLSPESARKGIQKSDKERKGFFNFAFNLNWDDPSLYDLTINTAKLGNEAAANLITETARLDEIKACSLAALETMGKLSQERAVRAVLLKHHVNLTLLHPEVPRIGTVALRGFAYSDEDKEQVVKLVKTVPGIAEVEPKISILQQMNE